MDGEVTLLEWMLMLLVVALTLEVLPFEFKGTFNKAQGHNKTKCRKCTKQRITNRRRFPYKRLDKKVKRHNKEIFNKTINKYIDKYKNLTSMDQTAIQCLLFSIIMILFLTLFFV